MPDGTDTTPTTDRKSDGTAAGRAGHTVTLQVDRNALFDAISAVGDGGQAVGMRLAGVLLAGEPDFFDTLGLLTYGIEVLPGTPA